MDERENNLNALNFNTFSKIKDRVEGYITQTCDLVTSCDVFETLGFFTFKTVNVHKNLFNPLKESKQGRKKHISFVNVH